MHRFESLLGRVACFLSLGFYKRCMARYQGLRVSLAEVVAIDAGSRVTKAVHLCRRADGYAVVAHALFETPSGERGGAGPRWVEVFRRATKALKTTCRHVVVVLGPPAAQLMHVDLPHTSVSDLRKMIKLSPKSYLQQDLPDHLFDCYYRRSARGSDTSAFRRARSKVMVGALRRQLVDEISEAARVVGLSLVQITAVPVALANAFRQVREDARPEITALLELGAVHSTINIVRNGDLVLTRSIALGAEKFADVLGPGDRDGQGRSGEDPSSEAMQARLQKAILSFAMEVDASAGFYASQEEQHVSQLYVSGGTARSPLVLQMLESELSFSCEGWDLLGHLTVESPEPQARELESVLPQMVVAIGAGLGILREDAVHIDFLAEQHEAAELRRRDPVRRAVWAGAALVGAMLVWAGVLGYQWRLFHGEMRASERVLEGLRSENRDPWVAGEQSMRDRDIILSLQGHAAGRFLFAPVLDALQHVMVDGMQISRARLSRTVVVTQPQPAPGVAGKPDEERVERVVLTLQLRNFGDTTTYSNLVGSITAHPFFAAHLRTDNPVVTLGWGKPVTDPLDPDSDFNPIAVECHFRERRITP
jgi:type IV pilus assembly protein PilM